MYIVCYADDTLIVATASGAFDAALRANIMAAYVVRCIKKLGLKVTAEKTEAVFFHGKKNKPRSMPRVYVDNTYIATTTSMKYLGVVIDSGWSFTDHFGYVESKKAKMSRALFRLIPYLRDPYEEKRRLYASVLTSVVTYAAPIWSNAFSSASPKFLQPIIILQRSTAIRVVSGYRTISFGVATLLAGMPPWTLEVAMRRRVYDRVIDLRRRKEWSKEAVADLKKQERNIMNQQWTIFLDRPGAPDVFTRGIIMPHFSKWLGRKFGNTSFQMTQMLTGHGCFGHYLNRMRK